MPTLYTLSVRVPPSVGAIRAPPEPRPLTRPTSFFPLQIYNRQGVPLFHREWLRPVAVKDISEEHKLMFGFLFSLKQLVAKMSPRKYAHYRRGALLTNRLASYVSCSLPACA
jgi:hypothetical protein